MCFQRSSKRIEGESQPPKPRWKVVPQSRTSSRETPVTKFVMCWWHEQLPDVVGMRPQRATTSIRQKMTVVSKIRGSSTSERLMHKPRHLNGRSQCFQSGGLLRPEGPKARVGFLGRGQPAPSHQLGWSGGAL